MPKTLRAVFQLTPYATMQEDLARLAADMPPFSSLELGRLALPHPAAPEALEVVYLLTLRSRTGRTGRRALGRAVEAVKRWIPTAVFRDAPDLATLHARCRVLEKQFRSERSLFDAELQPDWAQPFLEGPPVAPSLLSVTWHTQAIPSFWEHLCQVAQGNPAMRYPTMYGGRLSGRVRFFGAPSPAGQKPREDHDLLFGSDRLNGDFRSAPRHPEDFARCLPLMEPDADLGSRDERDIPLVDRVGQVRFLAPPCPDGEEAPHWLLALPAEATTRFLEELAQSVQRHQRIMVALIDAPHSLPTQPFLNPSSDRDDLRRDDQVTVWSHFYAQRLVLGHDDSHRLEAALSYAWQQAGPEATWTQVCEAARQLKLTHPLLEALARGEEVVVTEWDHVLLRMANLVLGGPRPPYGYGDVVVLPPLAWRAIPRCQHDLTLFKTLLELGRQRGILFVCPLRGPDAWPAGAVDGLRRYMGLTLQASGETRPGRDARLSLVTADGRRGQFYFYGASPLLFTSLPVLDEISPSSQE